MLLNIKMKDIKPDLRVKLSNNCSKSKRVYPLFLHCEINQTPYIGCT